MRIRQSDLASFARCAQQKKLTDLQRAGALDQPAEQLSRTAFGTVIHHALHVMEKHHHYRDADPLQQALASFEYYWDQANIHVLTPPVTIWCARDTWAGMRRRGLATLELYWHQLEADRGKLLALEVPFTLPYELDGVAHELHGTMDRLSLRRTSQSFLNIEDFKSGQDYIGLRWNLQFTIYAWATTQPGFWEAWEDDEGEKLYEQFRLLPRRGTWISVRDGVRRSDAGWRGPQDYARMDAVLRGYVRAVEADNYPLSMTGAVCRFCPFSDGICGGVPVPDEDHGRGGPV